MSTHSNSTNDGNKSFFLSPKIDMQEINNDNFRILVTNARSLSPKIESLHRYFTELDIDVAMITESWLKDSSILDRDIIDLEYGTNLKIIYKNRPKKTVGARRGVDNF